MKKFIYAILGIFLFVNSINGIEPAYSTDAQQLNAKVLSASSTAAVTKVQPLDVVKTPQKYLNKTIMMNATFDKFSTLGLDYKPAYRSSQDYIGILIRRDDVIDHVIPLSEMKLFLKRDLAEKNINLDSEDKILITAKVFSTALGDPWLDVTDIKVLKKAPKPEKK